MNPERKCEKCGTPLSDNLIQGLCPRCLAKAFAEPPPADEAETVKPAFELSYLQ